MNRPALLCKLRSAREDCALADYLTAHALHRFGPMLEFAPQYDAIYVQWMLAIYSLEHDSVLYALAADNARNAESRARNGEGLYLLS